MAKAAGNTEHISMDVGSHQGSVSSPLIQDMLTGNSEKASYGQCGLQNLELCNEHVDIIKRSVWKRNDLK